MQVAVEGVDQLETYFGAYLPQFFYAMLAPLTLFAVLCFVNMPAAFALLVCVPLIPVAIAAVQTWAKKLLSRYWGQYTKLGDTFLENLQGLTTLKIYQADGLRNDVMNEEAEKFRKITMKVLTMQLNSVTIMDVIAYGGAALGVILAATQYRAGHVALSGALLIILLSADFFHSHAAVRLVFPHCHERHGSKRKRSFACSICRSRRRARRPARTGTSSVGVCIFPTLRSREILHGLDLAFPAGSFTSIVGASGCGKSTIASILMGRSRGYTGAVTVGGVPLADISEDSLMRHITYVSHQSYLFKGTVRENLRMARPDAPDDALWAVLRQVKLAAFLEQEQGLDTPLTEQGSNLSGGQRQRLALARALLHDTPVYLFDEATSNIDVESENDIMAEIHALAGRKTVILISHRLANVTVSDNIYVLDGGALAGQGTHDALLRAGGAYARLWDAQQALENYAKEGAAL